jgi:hypothetical protein
MPMLLGFGCISSICNTKFAPDIAVSASYDLAIAEWTARQRNQFGVS